MQALRWAQWKGLWTCCLLAGSATITYTSPVKYPRDFLPLLNLHLCRTKLKGTKQQKRRQITVDHSPTTVQFGVPKWLKLAEVMPRDAGLDVRGAAPWPPTDVAGSFFHPARSPKCLFWTSSDPNSIYAHFVQQDNLLRNLYFCEIMNLIGESKKYFMFSVSQLLICSCFLYIEEKKTSKSPFFYNSHHRRYNMPRQHDRTTQ